MKSFTYFSFLIVFCISISGHASNGPGIHFLPDGTSLDKILGQSRAENKLIFIDAYTTWCGPCKWMDRNVFTAPEIGNFFNEHFINAKFNMEQGEGVELRKKYEVMAYPTFLFINADGEVVHRICGSSEKEAFLAKAKVALDDKNNLKSFVTKYNSGIRDVSFLSQYLELGVSICMEMGKVADEYWSLLDKENWITEENWGIFTSYVRDFQSDQFQYLINNYDAATADEKLAANIERYAEEILYRALLQPMTQKDGALLASNRQKIAQANIAPAKKALILIALLQHEEAKDWEGYFAEANKYIQAFRFDKPERINEFAWTIHQNIEDKKLLATAAGWMEEMLQEDKNIKYLYLETYAALLRKSGKVEEGDKVSAEAVALAESKGENYRVEREIREAKAVLRSELDQIGRDIEQAVKEGDTDKVAKLERARLDKISAHNEKITKLLAAEEKD